MKKKVDLTDGIEVAIFFITYYINVLGFKDEAFVEGMLQQTTEIKENFTYLAFKWLYNLSTVSDYNESNKNAVMMARDVCSHIPTELPKFHQLTYTGDSCMEIEVSNDNQVVAMMAGYLAADSRHSYRDFLLYALVEEGTLQQVLARLFRTWLRRFNDCPIAQEASIYCDKHTLPYI